MIKKLIVKNFQSHKKTILKFVPGLNVIVGSSDSGKSSLFRAMRWLAFNRPQGSAFQSHWGGDTEVKVRLEEGYITRHKGKENKYIVNDEILKAVRSDVPTEVSKMLDMPAINWQDQFDAHFLLSRSPGEVARTLNELVDLDEIDQGLSKADAMLRQNKSSIKYETERLEELRGKKKEYAYLKDMESDLKEMETMWGEVQQAQRKADELSKLLRKAQSKEKELKDARKLMQASDEVEAITDIYEKIKRAENEAGVIQEFLDDIMSQKKKNEETKTRLKALQKKIPDICPTCGKEL